MVKFREFHYFMKGLHPPLFQREIFRRVGHFIPCQRAKSSREATESDDLTRRLSERVVGATIEVFNRITRELLPTPQKSHYTFNLRDMAKVFQGDARSSLPVESIRSDFETAGLCSERHPSIKPNGEGSPSPLLPALSPGVPRWLLS